MEMLLLALTVLAIIVAGIMGAAAWRLSRDERARSGARVAALSVAASGEPWSESRHAHIRSADSRHADLRVAALQPAAEGRIVLDSRIGGLEPHQPVAVNEPRPAPWAPARVSPLAVARKSEVELGEFHAEDQPGIARPALKADGPPRTRDAAFSDTFLGSAVSQTPSGARRPGLAIAAMILCVLAIGAGYWMVFGDRATTASAATTAGSTAAPLELVSLRHERRGPRLEITGLVRNPAAGVSVDGIAAVVFFFDQSGGFISSARAGIEFKSLGAGDESPFVVSLEAPANVGRYRVSFRNEAGMLAHIDRRQVGR